MPSFPRLLLRPPTYRPGKSVLDSSYIEFRADDWRSVQEIKTKYFIPYTMYLCVLNQKQRPKFHLNVMITFTLVIFVLDITDDIPCYLVVSGRWYDVIQSVSQSIVWIIAQGVSSVCNNIVNLVFLTHIVSVFVVKVIQKTYYYLSEQIGISSFWRYFSVAKATLEIALSDC